MPLNHQDLLEKLDQMEQHASFGIQHYPNGLTLERLRHIAALARQLRSAVQDHIKEQPPLQHGWFRHRS